MLPVVSRITFIYFCYVSVCTCVRKFHWHKEIWTSRLHFLLLERIKPKYLLQSGTGNMVFNESLCGKARETRHRVPIPDPSPFSWSTSIVRSKTFSGKKPNHANSVGLHNGFFMSGNIWPLQPEMYRELQNTSFTSWITERSVLFSPLQQWPGMGKGQLCTWSLILRGAHYFMTLHFWMPTASKMEEQVSLPNVSIPCHNEQRDKKKRYTVRTKILFMFQFVVLRLINSAKGQLLVSQV